MDGFETYLEERSFQQLWMNCTLRGADHEQQHFSYVCGTELQIPIFQAYLPQMKAIEYLGG